VNNRLTNLIWVWSTDTRSDAAEYFPGREMVDIVGVEVSRSDHSARAEEFAAAREIGGAGLTMIAMVGRRRAQPRMQ
jgi:hypothetical protein